jgi:hypothetical protein
LPRVAIDEVGHQRHAFVERDESERPGRVALAHRAERIDDAGAGGVDPLGALAQAVRADVSRIEVRFAAVMAALHEQPYLFLVGVDPDRRVHAAPGGDELLELGDPFELAEERLQVGVVRAASLRRG